jgi:tetratricopeptide (TPR) repeat protein
VGADDALSAAIERAKEHGDLRIATRATLKRLSVRDSLGRTTDADVEAEVQRAIPVLEELGDDAGLASAWLLLAIPNDDEQAAERALVHARRAGLLREEEDALFVQLSGALYGDRPIAEVTEVCDRLLPGLHGPLAEVGTLEILAALKVRSGDVSEGRELYVTADRLYRELGMRYREAINWQCWGRSELATGDHKMAETAFRNSISRFEEIGDRFYQGAILVNLAHALCAQGRHDAAVSALDQSEELLGSYVSSLGLSARARVLAARGETEAALELARQGVAKTVDQHRPEGRAQTLVSLAEVLRRADRSSEEAAALQEALDLYERKGIKPAADRVRTRLGELDALPSR